MIKTPLNSISSSLDKFISLSVSESLSVDQATPNVLDQT